MHTGYPGWLRATDLGAWAELVQACVPHLRYMAHPVLQLLRGASHHHEWFLSTPPPGTLIYAMVHVYMLCIYVGKTNLQRVRRTHLPTICCGSLICMSGPLSPATYRRSLATADLSRTCFLERGWWLQLKRWTVNHCAPAVPTDDSPRPPPPPPQHNKPLHTLTHQLQTAAQDRGNASRAAISQELQSLAS